MNRFLSEYNINSIAYSLSQIDDDPNLPDKVKRGMIQWARNYPVNRLGHNALNEQFLRWFIPRYRGIETSTLLEKVCKTDIERKNECSWGKGPRGVRSQLVDRIGSKMDKRYNRPGMKPLNRSHLRVDEQMDEMYLGDLKVDDYLSDYDRRHMTSQICRNKYSQKNRKDNRYVATQLDQDCNFHTCDIDYDCRRCEGCMREYDYVDAPDRAKFKLCSTNNEFDGCDNYQPKTSKSSVALQEMTMGIYKEQMAHIGNRINNINGHDDREYAINKIAGAPNKKCLVRSKYDIPESAGDSVKSYFRDRHVKPYTKEYQDRAIRELFNREPMMVENKLLGKNSGQAKGLILNKMKQNYSNTF